MSDFNSYRLAELCSIEIGGTPSRSEPRYWSSSDRDGLPWVAIADLKERFIEKTTERISELGAEKSNVKLVPAGTVIMSFKLSIGRTAITKVPLYTNEAIAAFVPKNGDISNKYLFYILPKAAESAVTDTAIKGATLNKSKLASLIVEIPGIDQQEEIAEILITTDNLIERTENLIAKYQSTKLGLMNDFFTRGIDESGKLRPPVSEAPELYKESELGWIPKEWKVARIKDFAEVKGGKRMPAGVAFADTETPFPYIRAVDMKNGTVDQSDLRYVPVKIEPMIRAYKIRKEDLYITIAGVYLGEVGTIPAALDNAQLTENAARIVFNDIGAQSKRFIRGFLRSDNYRRQLEKAKGIGAGVPKLPLYQIERFVVPLPDIDEQKMIVSRLEVASDRIVSEEAYLHKLKRLKSGLMNDLLTGKVRVKVKERKAA